MKKILYLLLFIPVYIFGQDTPVSTIGDLTEISTISDTDVMVIEQADSTRKITYRTLQDSILYTLRDSVAAEMDSTTAQRTDINNNTDDISTLGTNQGTLRDSVVTNIGDISDLETNQGTLRDSVITNIGDINTLETNQGTLRDSVITNIGDINTLETNQGTLRDSVITNIGNISTLEGNQSDQADSIEALYGGAEDQIPVMNSSGTGFDYNSNFTFSGSHFKLPSNGWVDFGTYTGMHGSGDTIVYFTIDGAVKAYYDETHWLFYQSIRPLNNKTINFGTSDLFFDNGYFDRLYIDNTDTYIDVSGTDMRLRSADAGSVDLDDIAINTILADSLGWSGGFENTGEQPYLLFYDHATKTISYSDTTGWKGGSGGSSGQPGNVFVTGEPLDNQVAIWVNDTTIQGDVDITFDGDNLTVDGVITGDGFTIGSAVITETELEILDGATITTTQLNAGPDSITAQRTDINNNIDSLAVHLDTLQAIRADVLENIDSLAVHLDTLQALRVDINSNVDSLAVHLDTLQAIRSDLNANSISDTVVVPYTIPWATIDSASMETGRDYAPFQWPGPDTLGLDSICVGSITSGTPDFDFNIYVNDTLNTTATTAEALFNSNQTAGAGSTVLGQWFTPDNRTYVAPGEWIWFRFTEVTTKPEHGTTIEAKGAVGQSNMMMLSVKDTTTEETCATSRWEFDNSDVDENGVNDMTLTSATYSSTYKISGTHSMDCSAGNRYATTDNSITFGDEYFISTWFMTFETAATTERTLFTTLTSGEDGFDLRYDRNATRLEFETGNGASNTVAYSTSFTPSSGTWYHVAVSVNTSSGVTFFLNGSDVTSSGTLQSGFSTSGQARIGVDWNGSHYSYMYFDHTQWGPFTIDATDADYLYDNPSAELCKN